jgi:hypothetical protein
MILHTIGALGTFVEFLVAGFWYPAIFRKRPDWRWLVWPSLALVLLSIATGFLRSGQAPGLGQRLGFACFFVWIGLAGIGLVKSRQVPTTA